MAEGDKFEAASSSSGPLGEVEEAAAAANDHEEEAGRGAMPESGDGANGVKMENDETGKDESAPVKPKYISKPKAIPSLGHRNRFHPYAKEKSAGTGEKKSINHNRVFISNIPYDMKWQSIKDLMREKGNSLLTACFTKEWDKHKYLEYCDPYKFGLSVSTSV